ncbi:MULTISPECIES: DUF3397 domain-containing protein [Exiguobacterium]|uniref:DUF3397 family protein n=1 Tax=Exiguobacterium acetylicum TaxID=41170 RepID=A0ABX8G6B9_EXIAC|nr:MULTISPECIES: DUF3397 domain-containing protein [Exiguobacterium]AOT01168.1 hypothetical protein ESP131_13175 [Exiguobacterium sp. U13-1]QWB29120.1 DUF3397 family protein [Exiguobacterium acetylicum]HBQ75755.1 DUF3397 domain-containing protein [Exiguobacterium sp.]HCD59746.1 DUF3397 domain-containing protein [Exiguobacterium sp.]
MTVFIIFPLFSLIALYLVFLLLFRKHGKAVRVALDFGTFIVLYAIHVALIALTGTNYLGWIVIVVLLVFALNALWQRIRQLDVDLRQMIRHSWRIIILLALPVHFILFVLGIRQLFIS